MKASGTTIQIYCPAGEPRGVRIAWITVGTSQALIAPRPKLDEARARAELSGVGVYFLFGATDEGGLPLAYIGEAEDCSERLKQHNRTRDFAFVIAFLSRTGSFTKAHVKLLEWWSIERAARAGRYKLENRNAGGEPSVPEWMRDDVAQYFAELEILLGALGFPIFEPAVGGQAKDEDMFYCKRGGANARGVFNDEGFVVLSGSIARRDPNLSSHDTVEPRREELVGSGILVPSKDGYRFEQDWVFGTPSAAAAIVTGGAANGWTEWKNSRGQTLDEVYRSNTKG